MFRFLILSAVAMSSIVAHADLFNRLPQPSIRCASYRTDVSAYNLDITLFHDDTTGLNPSFGVVNGYGLEGNYYFQQPQGKQDIEYETFYYFGEYRSSDNKASMSVGNSYQDGSFDISVNGAGGHRNGLNTQSVSDTFRCIKGPRPTHPFFDTLADGRSLKKIIEEQDEAGRKILAAQEKDKQERERIANLLHTTGCTTAAVGFQKDNWRVLVGAGSLVRSIEDSSGVNPGDVNNVEVVDAKDCAINQAQEVLGYKCAETGTKGLLGMSAIDCEHKNSAIQAPVKLSHNGCKIVEFNNGKPGTALKTDSQRPDFDVVLTGSRVEPVKLPPGEPFPRYDELKVRVLEQPANCTLPNSWIDQGYRCAAKGTEGRVSLWMLNCDE
jgi:hypothetical protein